MKYLTVKSIEVGIFVYTDELRIRSLFQGLEKVGTQD